MLARPAGMIIAAACLLQAADQTIQVDAAAIGSAAPGIALVRFDLSAVPVTSVIASARLHLELEGSGAPLTIYDFGKDFAPGKPWTGAAPRRYTDYDIEPFSFRSRIYPDAGKAETDIWPLLKTVISTRRKTVSLAILSDKASTVSAKKATLSITFSTTAPRAVANYPLTDDKFGPVSLDASESARPDGGKTGLAYRWWVETPAAGSSNSPGQELGRDVKIKFEPDVPGLWKVRLRVTDTATKEFGETTVTFTSAQLVPHPRLGLNTALMNQIQVMRTTKKPQWERFQTWLNAPQEPSYGSKGEALLYGYVISRNQAYFEQAWKLYADRLYTNGKDRAQGLRPFFGECGKALYCKDREAASPGGFVIMEIALLYDWGFDALNAKQRVDVIEWLNSAAEYNYHSNPYVHAHFGDEGAAIVLGLCAASYATYGENRPALQQRRWFREEWEHTLRALDVMGKGGATAAPDTYGQVTASALINTANLLFYATSENLFVSHPWFQRRLAFAAFSRDNRRPDGLALARRFPGTEEADLWNAVFRQPGADETSEAWADLYYFSMPPAQIKPKRLTFFDPSMGEVFVRSGWTSPDSTLIQAHAGPHLSDRQALDQGAFTFSGKLEATPSGQSVNPPELVDFDDYFAHPDVYDVAKVTSFGDNGQATTWSADLTRAYSGDASKKVYRRLVYLREGDVLLVADTVKGVSTVRAEGKQKPSLVPFDAADTFGATVAVNAKNYKVTFTKLTPDAPKIEGIDLHAPALSNVKPVSPVPAGTSRTTLSVTTNVPSQCRFAYKPNTMFPYMNGSFLSSDGLTHTVQSGALDGGDTYTYYIRCQDKAGNENLEDLRLRFSVNK